MENPLNEINKIIKFKKFIELKKIDNIINSTSFDVMKKKEISLKRFLLTHYILNFLIY